jgi:hypothetical protein
MGIAVATDRQIGADVAICHGSEPAGVTRIMVRLPKHARRCRNLCQP